MAKRWLWGNFGDGTGRTEFDGVIGVGNLLPWTKGGDSAMIDINADDSFTVNISALDFPNWRDNLKVGRTLLVCENDDPNIPWDDPRKILVAGWLSKINPRLGETLQLKGEGLLEYMRRQAVNNIYSSDPITNPTSKISFQAGSYPKLIEKIILHCFDNTSIPNGVRTPNILGTIPNFPDGSGITYDVLYTDFKNYAEVLEDIRDNISDYGTEFRFVPRWENEERHRIVFDVVIGGGGSITDAHIGEGTVTNLQFTELTNLNKPSSLGVVENIEGVSTRFIGQSKYGDVKTQTGADITARIVTDAGIPKFDDFFNPGVELTQAQMEEQLLARLNSSTTFAEGSYTIEEDFNFDWKTKLGTVLNFDVSGVPGFGNATVKFRVVSLSFSASKGSVEVGLTVLQPRYPSLPKKRKDREDDKPIVPSYRPNVPVGTSPTENPQRPPTTKLPAGWSSAGYNGAGQLGQGGTQGTHQFMGTQRGEIPEDATIVQVAGGFQHYIILTSDGKTYGVGRRNYFSLDGSITTNPSVPVELEFTGIDEIKSTHNGAMTWWTSSGSWTNWVSGVWLRSGNTLQRSDGRGLKTFPNNIAFWTGSYVILETGESYIFGAESANDAIWKEITVSGTDLYNTFDMESVAFGKKSGYGLYFAFHTHGNPHEIVVLANNGTYNTISPNFNYHRSVMTHNYGDEIKLYGIMNGLLFLTIDGILYTVDIQYNNRPINPVPGVGNIRFKDVLVTYDHNNFFMLAIDEENRLWGWGSNRSGQLGITTAPQNIPQATRYITSSKVKSVAISPGIASGTGTPSSSAWVESGDGDPLV